jgi:hypothetical protein
MINLVKKLLGLCDHKWEIINQFELKKSSGSYVGTSYHLKCSKYGKLDNKILQ